MNPPGPRALLGAVLAATAMSAGAAAAYTPPDQFPLGISPRSGAVCAAVRDEEDAAAEMRGATAWDVRCRGWDAALGKLYAYTWKGAEAVGPGGVWTKDLAAHATCEPASPARLEALPGATLARCKAFDAKVDYLAYRARRGGRTVAAEGFANLDDVLQTGLRVVAGVARPPKATETLGVIASAAIGDGGGLAQATQAAATSPQNLRERGFNRNIAWRFADAETDFAALAQDPDAPASERAEAYLNWALNTSNLGRFNRADALFDEARRLIGSDPILRGELLSYKALDSRNRRDFAAAISEAKAARAIFEAMSPTSGTTAARPQISKDADGDIVIGAAMANALRSGSGFATAGLSAAARVKVQIAQTYLTQATAEQASGDADAARRDLELAHNLLSDPSLLRIAVWLRVQVDSELARDDQAAGRYAQARARLTLALQQLRTREAGSPAEAYLVMELARAEAIAGDQAAALRDFDQGIALFKLSRGSLGASADSTDTYFSLLLDRIAKDPAHADDYENRFFGAAESLGSEATADTIARLSARLNQSDTAAGGLIRALEDTRRQVRLKTAEISALQAQNAYPPPVRAAREAELKALTAQAQDLERKVAAADPRYGQLVSTEVDLKQLQADLKPGEVYEKVLLLDQGGYAMAIGHDWARAYRVALDRTSAAQAIAHLRKPFEAQNYLPAYDVGASYQFFQSVFGPVRDQILGANHIVYEPDPTILALPIAALATDQKSVDLIAGRRAAIRAKGAGVLSYDGVAWLGRQALTSLVLSAASFVQTRGLPASAASRPFIGFGASVSPAPGDPHAYASVVNHAAAGQRSVIDDEVCEATRTALFDLKPLNEAAHELATVGASLGAVPDTAITGAAFNNAAIEARTDLNQYRVVYFATHGLLPRPGGCLPEPSLLTSVDDKAAGSDGLLTASDILELKLDADLVVLSACDTGGTVTGELDRSGLGGAAEALGGLSRAFIYAGGRSLLVSQWQIDSKATVRLMTSMFAAHQPSLGGALRAAEDTLMASKDQYSHPYYWAAFTVVGDAGRPMPLR